MRTERVCVLAWDDVNSCEIGPSLDLLALLSSLPLKPPPPPVHTHTHTHTHTLHVHVIFIIDAFITPLFSLFEYPA